MDTREKNSALHLAAVRGDIGMVNYLVHQQGADYGQPNTLIQHWAARHGYAAILREFVKQGVGLTLTDKNGDTPLHVAIANGHTECVSAILDILDPAKNLLTNYSDPKNSPKLTKTEFVNKTNNRNQSALHLAAVRGDIGMVNYLVHQQGADFGQPNMLIQHWAARHGYAAILREFIKQGVGLTLADKNGDTPLHVAIANGHTECVSAILDTLDPAKNLLTNYSDPKNSPKLTKTEFVNKTNNRNQSALHLAAVRGDIGMVNYLVHQQGADYGQPNTLIQHWAARHGYAAILREFIKQGVGLTLTDKNGDTPLHVAIANGHTECVSAILDTLVPAKNLLTNYSYPKNSPKLTKIEFINKANNFGRTALHAAAASGNIAVLEYLISQGADLHAKCHEGKTVLDYALANNRTAAVQWLEQISEFHLDGGKATVIVTKTTKPTGVDKEFSVTYKDSKNQHFSCMVREVESIGAWFSSGADKMRVHSSTGTKIVISSASVKDEIRHHAHLPEEQRARAAIARVALREVDDLHSVVHSNQNNLTNFDSSVQATRGLKEKILKSHVFVQDGPGLFFSKATQGGQSRWTMGYMPPVETRSLWNDPDLSSTKPGLVLGKPPSALTDIPPLFRGDATDFRDVCNNGFVARGQNNNLLLHVNPPGQTEYLIDSAFISTTASKEKALTFPRSLQLSDETTSYVYEIRSKSPNTDVAEALAPKLTQGKLSWEDYSILIRDEQERVFLSKISPSEISGAWEVGIKRIQTANPADFPFCTWSKKAIEEHCYENVRTLREPFIPNPNYRYPGQKFFVAGRSAGHLLTGLGLALDGASLYREYQHSQESGNYNNTYREGARIVGGWTGARSTGLLFAEKGAILCKGLHPYVQAACVIGGGLLGSAVGYYGGSMMGTRIFDVANKPLTPMKLMTPARTTQITSHLSSAPSIPSPVRVNPTPAAHASTQVPSYAARVSPKITAKITITPSPLAAKASLVAPKLPPKPLPKPPVVTANPDAGRLIQLQREEIQRSEARTLELREKVRAAHAKSVRDRHEKHMLQCKQQEREKEERTKKEKAQREKAAREQEARRKHEHQRHTNYLHHANQTSRGLGKPSIGASGGGMFSPNRNYSSISTYQLNNNGSRGSLVSVSTYRNGPCGQVRVGGKR